MIRIGFDRYWIFTSWFVLAIAAVDIVFWSISGSICLHACGPQLSNPGDDPIYLFLWPFTGLFQLILSPSPFPDLIGPKGVFIPGPHTLFAAFVSAYVLVTPLIGLRVLRNPMIEWYASSGWIVFGKGAVDIFFKNLQRRCIWELFIMLLSFCFSPLGLWVVAIAQNQSGDELDDNEPEDEHEDENDHEQERSHRTSLVAGVAGGSGQARQASPRWNDVAARSAPQNQGNMGARWVINLLILSAVAYGGYRLAGHNDSTPSASQVTQSEAVQSVPAQTATELGDVIKGVPDSTPTPSTPPPSQSFTTYAPTPVPRRESESTEASVTPGPSPQDVARKGLLIAPFDVPPQVDPHHPLTQPPYPSGARHKHEEGSVVLSLLIAPTGKVEAAEVFEFSGFPLLDDAAVQTAKEKWKFKPATKAGEPVEAPHKLKVTFRE